MSEQHTETFERTLWTAICRLKERVVLHRQLVEGKKRTRAKMLKRHEESVATAEDDLKLLRDILEGM